MKVVWFWVPTVPWKGIPHVVWTTVAHWHHGVLKLVYQQAAHQLMGS